MNNDEELTIIPIKSFVFIGREVEWNEIIQTEESHPCNVLLLKNDNTLTYRELVWCENKKAVFVPPKKIRTFNIDDFSNNYSIYISDSVTPLSNETEELFREQEKLERIEKERREKEKQRRLNEINNAKEISIKELFSDKTNNGPFAIEFEKGTNFQKELRKGKGCLYLNHDLRIVIGILYDKSGIKKRIGRVFVCSTCGRTYLGKSTLINTNLNDFPDYSFTNWPESNEIGRIESQRPSSETIQVPPNNTHDRIAEMKKRYPLKTPEKKGDTVLIDEDEAIFYGDILIHKTQKNHRLIECKTGILEKGKRRYLFYKQSTYCADCAKFFLSPIRPIGRLSIKHPYNRFIEGDWYREQLIEEKQRRREEQEARRKRNEELKELRKKKNEEDRKKKLEQSSISNLKVDQEIRKAASIIGAKDFLVRTNSFSCRIRGHKCKEITACVTLIRQNSKIQDVFLPGWYCDKCKCYYISERDYQKLDKMGVIVAKVYTEKEWMNQQSGRKDFSGLSSQSLLNKLGYNVSASQGLSDSIRQDVLASALDFNLMSKREMIDFITWLINTRENNDVMQNAISKWKTDLDFVSKYKLNSKQYVRIGSISLNQYFRLDAR